jgi:hypothetical protein
MKVGDIVKHNLIEGTMSELLYSAKGWEHDFKTGIIIDIEQDISSTHVQVYANNEMGWYDLSELKVIRGNR